MSWGHFLGEPFRVWLLGSQGGLFCTHSRGARRDRGRETGFGLKLPHDGLNPGKSVLWRGLHGLGGREAVVRGDGLQKS